MKPADYTCEPKGVVSCDEVTQIAKVLRRTPQIETGVVGDFGLGKEVPVEILPIVQGSCTG